jgi:hypothetical protein
MSISVDNVSTLAIDYHLEINGGFGRFEPLLKGKAGRRVYRRLALGKAPIRTIAEVLSKAARSARSA